MGGRRGNVTWRAPQRAQLRIRWRTHLRTHLRTQWRTQWRAPLYRIAGYENTKGYAHRASGQAVLRLPARGRVRGDVENHSVVAGAARFLVGRVEPRGRRQSRDAKDRHCDSGALSGQEARWVRHRRLHPSSTSHRRFQRPRRNDLHRRRVSGRVVSVRIRVQAQRLPSPRLLLLARAKRQETS